MSDEQGKRKGVWLPATLALALLCIYVGGYFTSDFIPSEPVKKDLEIPGLILPHRRVFSYHWAKAIYQPAALIEGLLRGQPVRLDTT